MYNAATIVEFLTEQKKKSFIDGLERVLIWTSDKSKMKDPSFLMAEGFDVYGLIKGENKDGKTILPEEGLVQHLDAIYEDVFQQQIKPLNHGWKKYAGKDLDEQI